MESLQPRKRTALRLFCGRFFYTTRRYCMWFLGKYQFSSKKREQDLGYTYFKHSTPLLRKLKDVDMYLQYNKIDNLRIAVSKINNIVIYPGETFSYWKLIGRPTKQKGYKEGMMLCGGAFKPSVGGGLCQLSNLIYWMTLHTPLTVTERYRHSYDVFPDSNRVLPFGSGATCVYNYRDLMITNETNQPFQLKVWMTTEELCGCYTSISRPLETYQVYEKNQEMKLELFGMYSRNNWIYRKIYDIHGTELSDEYVTENHALMMYEPFIEVHLN